MNRYKCVRRTFNTLEAAKVHASAIYDATGNIVVIEAVRPSMWYVEITDTFGGDANYSWVTRHKVRAYSPRGAMVRIGRASGLSWRYVGNDRYDSASGATCAFVSEYDPAEHADLRNLNTLLEN